MKKQIDPVIEQAIKRKLEEKQNRELVLRSIHEQECMITGMLLKKK